MSVAHEMWRLAMTPPAPLLYGVMFLALAWTLAFRKQDRDAWVMCATLIALGVVELFFKSVLHDDAFRAFLAVSDAIAATVAVILGNRSHREWLLAVYTTCVYAVALHVLWLLGPGRAVFEHREYVGLLNILLVARLLAITFPGVAYVGKIAGDLLFGPSRRFAFRKARR